MEKCNGSGWLCIGGDCPACKAVETPPVEAILCDGCDNCDQESDADTGSGD